LRWVLSLGVISELHKGPLSVDALAKATDANYLMCQAVTDYLIALGYLVRVEDRLRMTELGEALASLPPDLYAPASPMTTFDRAASELGSAWSLGGPVKSRLETSVWQEIARDPEACRTVGRYQHGAVQFDGQQLISALAGARPQSPASVLDLGGSNGALARDLLEAGGWRVGVLDLPEMIPNARRNLGDAVSNVTLHGGSFFRPVPDGYDCYVLNAILADYTDELVSRLVRCLRDSMPENARLVVSEVTLMSEDTYTRAESALLLTLNTGGRVRSRIGVVKLVQEAGFTRLMYERSTELRYTLVFAR
jgi:hypothetical protein